VRGRGRSEPDGVTKGSENVFVDLGYPPSEAENLRLRVKMMIALTGYIQDRKMNQAAAAKIMGVPSPGSQTWSAARLACSQSTRW